jgi:hypothetical protein
MVETSLHALSAGYGGPGQRSARKGPVYHFSKEAMPSPRLARGSLHTLARHLMAQLPSLQEPCAIKVVREEGFQYEFD